MKPASLAAWILKPPTRRATLHDAQARPAGCPRGDQRWSTFLRTTPRPSSHVTFSWPSRRHFACFTYLWVIHHSSRRLLSFNVTEHSTSAWTLQQLRDAVRYEQCYRYLIHDRDSIFAKRLDESIARLSMVVLKSPYQSPKANAICERVIGTIRRECLDWVIPLSEAHLRLILKWWVSHYNRGRPHMSLAPGVPDPPATPRLGRGSDIPASSRRRPCRAC